MLPIWGQRCAPPGAAPVDEHMRAFGHSGKAMFIFESLKAALLWIERRLRDASR
jgi:hypothetical protein